MDWLRTMPMRIVTKMARKMATKMARKMATKMARKTVITANPLENYGTKYVL